MATMQEVQNCNEKDAARTLHAVIIPFPAQGHITPCLQLAKRLVGLGFRITFVNTIHNHERMMKVRTKATVNPHKGIEFVAISDGLPDDHPRLHDLAAFCGVVLKMGPVFQELYVDLLRKSPITCVIHDIGLAPAHECAKKLGIPVVGIPPSSAIAMQCYYYLSTFVAAGILPLPAPPPAYAQTPSLDPVKFTLALPRTESEIVTRQAPLTCLPGGSPTMRVNDIPTFLLTHDLDSFFIQFYKKHHNATLRDLDCILFNTFHALECNILDAIAGDMNSHIYAIGPLAFDSTGISRDKVEEELSLVGPGSGSSLLEEDSISLDWLDHQTPNSVLFVSFGSMTTVSVQQMREFAAGLEQSQHAFLWVIRPDLIESIGDDNEFQVMFSDFVERTRDRALLVPWVPQTAVLSHPSVAAFLTHCGWNSTIESIATGVPMLGWPRFGDHNTNCHYIVHVWKIGLELIQSHSDRDGTTIVSKEEVAQKVKKILACDKTDLEVAEIRTNSGNFQVAATKAVQQSGSSGTALKKFVERMRATTKYPPPPPMHT